MSGKKSKLPKEPGKNKAASSGKIRAGKSSAEDRRKGKTEVIIYPDWCKGCGICVAFCPAKVLELGTDGKAYVARGDECVNCGFCELHCPDFAIVVRARENRKKP